MRAGRRPDAHRPRRGRGRAAGRRRVRLLHRPAGRHRLHHDARLPPEHLPGRHRHAGPGAARALRRARPSTSSTTCWLVAEETREHHGRRWASRTFEELVGRTDLLEADAAIDHWKARRRRPERRRSPCPEVAPGEPRRRTEPPAAGARRRAGLAADRGLRSRRSTAASRCAWSATVRNVNRTVGGAAVQRDRAPPRRRAACPRARSRSRFSGSAGQSFGAWLAPGVTLHAARRRQRLRGQGPVRAACSPCARRRATRTPPRTT